MPDKKSWQKIIQITSVLTGIVFLLAFSWLVVYFMAKKTAEYKEVNPYYTWGQPAEYQSPDQPMQSALDEETQRRKNSEQSFQRMQKNTETELGQIEMNKNLDKPQKSIDQFNRRQQSLDMQREFANKPF
jgi:DNA mismatch repair ATPase MutS